MEERDNLLCIWDFKELKRFKHNSVVAEPFNMWPSGNCGHVYSASNKQAKRHLSGWAMRNTNNHNVNILKKSCLGVLVCNQNYLTANCSSIAVRPAICDKARSKQIGHKCPSECGGVLVMQHCTGHKGHPVTHFWRRIEDNVFFIGKGYHDHPMPSVKLTSGKKNVKTRIQKTKTLMKSSSRIPSSVPAKTQTLSHHQLSTESTSPYQKEDSNNNTAINYSALRNQNSTNYSQPPPPLANQHFQQQQQQLLLEHHLQNQLQVQQTIQLQQLQNLCSSYPSCYYQQQDLCHKYNETENVGGALDNSLNQLWIPPAVEGRSQTAYTDSTSDSRYRFLQRQNTVTSYSSNSAVLPSPLTATSHSSLDLAVKTSYYPYQTATQLSTTTTLAEEPVGPILDLSMASNTVSTWRSDDIHAAVGSSTREDRQNGFKSVPASFAIPEDYSIQYPPKITADSSFPGLVDNSNEAGSPVNIYLPQVHEKYLERNMVSTLQQTAIPQLIDIEAMETADVSDLVNLSSSANHPPPTLISDQPTSTLMSPHYSTNYTSSLPALYSSNNASYLPTLSSLLRRIEYL